jgi:hypothetical protein
MRLRLSSWEATAQKRLSARYRNCPIVGRRLAGAVPPTIPRKPFANLYRCDGGAGHAHARKIVVIQWLERTRFVTAKAMQKVFNVIGQP